MQDCHFLACDHIDVFKELHQTICGTWRTCRDTPSLITVRSVDLKCIAWVDERKVCNLAADAREAGRKSAVSKKAPHGRAFV